MQSKLESRGYFVIRAAGSHGVADLIAIKIEKNVWNDRNMRYEEVTEILFISCKIPMYAPPAERKALLEAAERCGAIAKITVKNKSGEWELQTLVP